VIGAREKNTGKVRPAQKKNRNPGRDNTLLGGSIARGGEKKKGAQDKCGGKKRATSMPESKKTKKTYWEKRGEKREYLEADLKTVPEEKWNAPK